MTAIAPQPVAAGKRLKGEDVGVPVRKLGQVYGDDIPDFWFRNNAFLTMFFGGFSANLPEGEAQFIHSVRLFQDKITDPVLLAQVRAFIGQEAHHSKEHDALNACMKRKGYPLEKIEKRMRTLNKWMQKYQSPAKQLAGTVCGEHITALMADYMLSKDPDALNDMPAELNTLWGWHAIEETEHKGVAFDVYDQLVGDRTLLRITMAEITLLFFTLNTVQALAMMPRTGQVTNLTMWREAAGFLGKMARKSVSEYLDFYKRDYHPWQHDNRAALEAAKKRFLPSAT